MSSKKQKLRSRNKWLIGNLFAITAILMPISGQAIVPYIYKPEVEALKKTGLTIGRTAAQLIQIGKHRDAARLAELAVRVEPEDPRLWSILAEAQLRSELFNEASRSLAKAKKLDPNKASLWFAEASLAIKQNKIEVAIPLLDRGLELEPSNAGGYFHLGNARVLQKKLPLAAKAFKQASDINPSFWEALNNEGLVHFEMGNLKQAIKSWRKVLTIEKNAEPMLALASALNAIQPGNEESIELAINALAKNPNYVSSQHQKEQLWGTKLRQATSQLLTTPKLESAVDRAQANSDAKTQL